MRTRLLAAAGLLAFLLAPAAASAQSSTAVDAKVQAPELKAPERASLAGQLASVAFGPADVARGAFALPAPFALPAERGGPLAAIFPTYSPDAAIGEWGAGWQTSLALVRFRVSGDLDYATDELTGPFGRLTRGTDGAWYPVGLSKLVRVVESGDGFTAYLPDGATMRFGDAARVINSRGTYAWHLTDVQTATDRRTHLEWIANASGRLFLASVSYGGVGTDHPYRAELDYEPLARSFEDLRSGAVLALDRRVTAVRALVRNASTGALEERWRYELAYEDEGFGPGFYLTQVQQAFRSGERPPPTTYGYRHAAEKLASTALEPVPAVASILSTLGLDALQPTRSTQLDFEADGVVDLEHQYDYRLVRQSETGFTFEPLAPAPPDVYAACRRGPNVYNPPRVLARLRSGAADENTYVLDLVTDTYATRTSISVCNRIGQRLANQIVTSDWRLGAAGRLVDVNRDHRPDLVRVYNGGYRILPNSSSASTFSFGAAVSGTLSPVVTVDTAWVQDFNGDGIVDLIVRAADPISSLNWRIWVWRGLGNFRFETQGRSYGFFAPNGAQLMTLKEYGITWVDANKDGLADAILSRTTGNVTYLYMNRGDRFVSTGVPGLAAVDTSTSRPVIADLRASGNTEISFVKGGQGYSIALDGPDTGLMAWADDGKGTTLTFEYARARPAPAAPDRQAVLANLTVRSSGSGDVSYGYDYALPKVHSAGKFLLGYDEVARQRPLGDETVTFLNEDRYSGVLLATSSRDSLVPGIEQFSARSFEDAVFQGIPWKRLASEESGLRATDGTGRKVSATARTLAYWNEVCPSIVEKAGDAGTLTLQTTYARLPAFSNALACIATDVVETGVHPDPSLDFTHETSIGRNAVGLATSVSSVSTAGTWTLQEVTYTPDWLVATVSSPGKGATVVTYDAATRLPRSVTSPEGVVVEAIGRDPLADAVTMLRTTRGVLVHDQTFAYDGLERLEVASDDLGASLQLAYRYATADAPGSVTTWATIDAAAGAVRETMDLVTARGDAVATASRIPGAWAVGSIAWREPSQGRTSAFRGPALTVPDPGTLDYAALFASADPVEWKVAGPFGVASESVVRLHADVERRAAESLRIENGLTVVDAWENNQFVTTSATDSSGNVVLKRDEAGTDWSYEYDALGRLRAVHLPDGKAHRVHYDVHGRVDRVEREGIATIEYSYEPTTGLLAEKRFLSPAGALQRTVSLSYDAVGRIRVETDTAPGTAAKEFTFFYDGASPEEPLRADRPGLLTAVRGDGYVKHLSYRSDGKLTRRTLDLAGWRTIRTDLAYNDAGEVRATTVLVSAGDVQLVSTATRDEYDANGRAVTTSLGSGTLASYGYDAEGKLAGVAFGNGDILQFTYDPLTRAATGSRQDTPGYAASTERRMNARGLVQSEAMLVGEVSLSRQYGYSAQRFLTSSTDPAKAYGYFFDRSGLPTRIEEDGVAREIVQSGDTLVAGDVTYRFDALGRTIQRGDLFLEYGADGQVARATRGARVWTFIHDEAGQRLAKLENGTPVAAYPEEGYLDAAQLVQPVKVAGRTVGVLRNGAYETVATNLLGTVLAEPDGTPRIASPFGARDVHPGIAAALDYVEKGFDADLGLVRMGVRDYDPEISRFTTADSLTLENLEHSLEAVRDANLYGYAGNLPSQQIDPTGLQTAADGVIPNPLHLFEYQLSELFGWVGGGRTVSDGKGHWGWTGPEPWNGASGVYLGAARALTCRLYPADPHASPMGAAGGDFGASLVPLLDPFMRLVTGETAFGREASRIGAGVELGLQVVPFLAKNSTNIVYRALNQNDVESLGKLLGLEAKNPAGSWTLGEHIVQGSSPASWANDPWIATTRDINVARAFDSGRGVVAIDLNRVSALQARAWELYPRVPGPEGLPYQFSIWQQEVSVLGSIPREAILGYVR
jgi:RHS repeat-associated protein